MEKGRVGERMKGFKKITYDMSEKEILEAVPTNVQEKLNEIIDSYKSTIINSLINCESPIEQLLALKLNERLYKYYSVNGNVEVLGFENQAIIDCKSKKYRVDFLIELVFKEYGRYKDLLKLVIECDGHDFHEKTKEQVRKDNERVRAIQNEGYEVLRFSGSEIYNNTEKCINEIIKFIFSRYNIFLNR